MADASACYLLLHAIDNRLFSKRIEFCSAGNLLSNLPSNGIFNFMLQWNFRVNTIRFLLAYVCRWVNCASVCECVHVCAIIRLASSIGGASLALQPQSSHQRSTSIASQSLPRNIQTPIDRSIESQATATPMLKSRSLDHSQQPQREEHLKFHCLVSISRISVQIHTNRISSCFFLRHFLWCLLAGSSWKRWWWKLWDIDYKAHQRAVCLVVCGCVVFKSSSQVVVLRSSAQCPTLPEHQPIHRRCQ